MVTDGEHVSAALLLDPEALLLCGLMWAGNGHQASDRVCAVLAGADFYDPHHGRLFELIATRRAVGQPTDPASLRSALSAQGSAAALPHRTAESVLLDLATLGVRAEQVLSYADQVLGASYRRQFQAMAAALVHAGETAPEHDLFRIMVAHGKAQRAAWQRRQVLREVLPGDQ
ncbi:GcrE [Corynebacterium hylobatis]|uniref:GcrE n=1 Tax=Corynebacterium hylobatis TaxID=1859290 RepID=A0A3S0B4D4_9CORY|nr:DnaB-like helicase N-terminal domain-containing protein [Corynebacterium hylobatis]RSZ63466.1 GcrE [Corynebacterium hylobatis]